VSAEVALIELRGVTRTYSSPRRPDVDALRGIDLEIEHGEFVAIVGPSGGGKSTLLNILGILDDPTSGEYMLDGTTVRTGDGSQAAALRAGTIGFVFQAFHLLDQRPAIDSAELGLMYQGVARAARRERAQHAIETVGLGDRVFQSPAELSGGQRQRVAIARAIASDATLILADEPTGNLDSQSAARVLDELDRLHRDGTTIVVVTHSPEVAARAHRVVNIADGQLVSDTRRDVAPPPDAAPASEPAPPVTTKLRLRDVFRDAWASVLSRPVQTAGQCAAVAIAVALTITSLGLSSSSAAQVSTTFDAHLNREVTATWSTALPHSLDLVDVPERVDAVEGVDAAAVVLDLAPSAVGTFAESREVRQHLAIGDITSAARLTVVMARWHQGPLRSDQALVGDLLADQLHLGSIDSAPTITVDGTDFVVAGLITESSRLPLLRGEIILGAPDDPTPRGPTDVNLLVVTSSGAAQQVARQLPSVLNPFVPEQLSVAAPTDSATLRGQIEQGVQATLLAFTVLALVVAIAALMNATALAVHSRRGEIGMRKALGARDRHIGTLITVESAYVGLLGGVAGLFLGMAAILTVTLSQRWTPVFDVALMPFAIAVGLLIGAGGGGLAAVRAARLRPADNLRS
jgi:macrolide transport system ATP-binding/permease protein